MFNSIKKTPIFGRTTAAPEKEDKKRWNKTFRKISKTQIFNQKELPNKISAVTDVWDGNKEGKRYFKDYGAKDMRK
ncbi:hypothetical protein [Pedobacter terrae]|uniref:hypothetical protein n=1 Tax=Pedobacter terrae TaxID=405671 RepID=UPI000B821E0C|nr:hypothetical protein [Pedobacter terrae]